MLSKTGKLDDLRPCAERPFLANKLSPEEEQTIPEQANSPEPIPHPSRSCPNWLIEAFISHLHQPFTVRYISTA